MLTSDELLEELLRAGSGLHQPVPGGGPGSEWAGQNGHAHLGTAPGHHLPQEHRQLLTLVTLGKIGK